LIYMRDRGPTEVGGFAISAADDVLFIEDIQMVRQRTTPVTVRFDDQAVADFFDRQIDAGLQPERFSRIWVHTHPGNCPIPSNTDEDTFERVFGQFEWAVMFILAEEGQSYARLRFSVGPGGAITIPVSVDYSRPFAASDFASWAREYATNVNREPAARRERLGSPTTAAELEASALQDPRELSDSFFDPFRDDRLDDHDLFLEGAMYDS
jgi:proteasome lid subunit RPN8/RPN11